MYGRVENNTCIKILPIASHESAKNWTNSPTLEVQLHQLPLRITTSFRLLHIEHLPLPKKRHFCIHSTMFYGFFTTLVWFVVLCVCTWINSNEKNKSVLCQPLVHLHLRYHRQFKQHSNWPKCCWPWIFWSLDWEHHYCVFKLHITFHNHQNL
jgi:hypothetical protein